jgi:threonine/homoserine/homoserine lactone efflux protein
MATLAVVGIVVMSGCALFAARALRLLRDPRQLCWMNRCFGVLIGRVNARC